jgi:hypothetical protein
VNAKSGEALERCQRMLGVATAALHNRASSSSTSKLSVPAWTHPSDERRLEGAELTADTECRRRAHDERLDAATDDGVGAAVRDGLESLRFGGAHDRSCERCSRSSSGGVASLHLLLPGVAPILRRPGGGDIAGATESCRRTALYVALAVECGHCCIGRHDEAVIMNEPTSRWSLAAALVTLLICTGTARDARAQFFVSPFCRL